MATLEAVQNSNIQQLSSPYIKPYPRPWLIKERTSRLLSTNDGRYPHVTPRRRIAPLNSTGAALQVELAPDPRLGKHDLIIYSTFLLGRSGR